MPPPSSLDGWTSIDGSPSSFEPGVIFIPSLPVLFVLLAASSHTRGLQDELDDLWP